MLVMISNTSSNVISIHTSVVVKLYYSRSECASLLYQQVFLRNDRYSRNDHCVYFADIVYRISADNQNHKQDTRNLKLPLSRAINIRFTRDFSRSNHTKSLREFGIFEIYRTRITTLIRQFPNRKNVFVTLIVLYP